MVAAIRNTTVSVLRGTGENRFGDTVDAAQPVITGLPAFLAETGKQVEDPSSPTPRTIRQVICHVPQWAGVLNSDRIWDETTSQAYMIIGVTTPPTLIGAPVDTILDLKRVTANTA